MNKVKKKALGQLAAELFEKEYQGAVCSLDYREGDAFQLLIATRLSAQCTDARVNIVTPGLFERFPDAESMAKAEIREIEELIKTCGLYKTKARDLVAMAQMLRDEYKGVIPDTVEELIKLPGVGRKSANLICGDVFGKPAVVTDTHCIRIAGRLGLTDSKDPYKVEMQLRKILPPEESNDFCHRLVLFGRDVCMARSPKCGECPLREICPSAT